MTFRIAEVFAGIGGVTCGFVDTGKFESVFLHDVDPTARRALVDNDESFSEIYQVGRIQNLTGPQLLDMAGGEIDGLLGCPPCQGLSAAGTRDESDPRNELLDHMRRLINSMRPRFFVMENVPSLLATSLYRNFEDSLRPYYRIVSGVINAAEHGLPQLRRRAVIIGLCNTTGVVPTLPKPTHGGAGTVFNYASGQYMDVIERDTRRELQVSLDVPENTKPLVTLGDALADLPMPSRESESIPYAGKPTSSFQRLIRRSNGSEVADHKPWRHRTKMIERLKRTKPGDSPSGDGTRSRNERYFSQAYARLHSDGLARTITTNFHNPGSGRFTHFEHPRTLTIREALRLQGFPDRFRFGDSVFATDAERMVGNAFPRILASALGRHISKLLS